MSRPIIIAIAGNIGAGKTSLVEFLQRSYDITPFYEPNDDNPYLVDFYRDMKRWAFHSQLYFLSSKFAMQQQLEQCSGVVLQDRTLFEDVEIFATALHRMRKINKRDWQTFMGLYETIKKTIQPPDLMIYLSCSIRTARKRIKLRGRKMEQHMPLAYLKRLSGLYQEWIDGYDMSEVLTIETDKLDYVNDLIDQLQLMTAIERYIPHNLKRQ
ncbi:deoxynucleoside kinase [Marinicella gelatinilytica]|uniref:deoxynucleoside kinase n=1 Tax=Marinicella gelatinilytica TaxID=2996017 RepID=UPI002260FEC7|nr:deoxynucleoside kinase [Marinicella gelatinilytica]MCX7545043.1 deoxynucleoside kinase [Marinicella gelatinilytica]